MPVEIGEICTDVAINEPAHYKTYNETCAISEDSNQTAHPRSLIRVFADRMYLLQPPGYPKGVNGNPCKTGWINRLICVLAGQKGRTAGFVAHWLKSVFRCMYIHKEHMGRAKNKCVFGVLWE